MRGAFCLLAGAVATRFMLEAVRGAFLLVKHFSLGYVLRAMPKTIEKPEKKPFVPRVVGFKFDEKLQEALDEALTDAQKSAPETTMSDVVRRLLRKALAS